MARLAEQFVWCLLNIVQSMTIVLDQKIVGRKTTVAPRYKMRLFG